MTSRYELFTYSDPKEVEQKLTDVLTAWNESCVDEMNETHEYASVQSIIKLTESKALLLEYSFFDDKDELIETYKFNTETKMYERIPRSSGNPATSGVGCPPGFGYLTTCGYDEYGCPRRAGSYYMTQILAKGGELPQIAVLTTPSSIKVCASPPPQF
jgi:hypothetical protein